MLNKKSINFLAISYLLKNSSATEDREGYGI